MVVCYASGVRDVVGLTETDQPVNAVLNRFIDDSAAELGLWIDGTVATGSCSVIQRSIIYDMAGLQVLANLTTRQARRLENAPSADILREQIDRKKWALQRDSRFERTK